MEGFFSPAFVKGAQLVDGYFDPEDDDEG